MMGRQSGQIVMLVIDMESVIPREHLLRKIDEIMMAMRVIVPNLIKRAMFVAELPQYLIFSMFWYEVKER